jgi:hypothetical protein
MISRKVLKTFERADGQERVLIMLRTDGAYTYARQWMEVDGWGKPGPDLGLYDSADAAETEAMQRVDWLKASFH